MTLCCGVSLFAFGAIWDRSFTTFVLLILRDILFSIALVILLVIAIFCKMSLSSTTVLRPHPIQFVVETTRIADSPFSISLANLSSLIRDRKSGSFLLSLLSCVVSVLSDGL